MSGKKAIQGDLPYQKEKVEQAFIGNGIAAIPYAVDVEAYLEFVGNGNYSDGEYGDYFAEKSLEHFLSFQFSELNEHSLVVDVANAGSSFPQIVNGIFGCKVISNDLNFPPGEVVMQCWHTRIGCNACDLPLENETVDLMTLHCALEMFEGEDDINLIKEASRVLKMGGKMVIVPLYINEVYHVLRDPNNSRSVQPDIDEGSLLVYRKNFFEVAFARFYSVDALCKRLLANSEDLEFSVYKVQNSETIGANVYLYWIGVFEKISAVKQ